MTLTAEDVNEINLENWKQFEWEIAAKTRILRIVNAERRQKEWNKLYPKLRESLPEEIY